MMRLVTAILLLFLGIALLILACVFFSLLRFLFPWPGLPAAEIPHRKVRRARVETVDPYVITVPPSLLPDIDREAWVEARKALGHQDPE